MRSTPEDASHAREIEFKLLLEGAAALEAVAATAERRGARRAGPVAQENHFFDTPSAALRGKGLVVRLRHEEGRHVLAVKGARLEGSDVRVHVRSEHEAELDDSLAREILARGRLALALVEARLGEGGTEIAARLRAVAETDELVHVGSFRNHRLRVGPLRVAGSPPLTLELDRTELPGGRVDYELELEVEEHARPETERLLAKLLAEAAVVGRSATAKARRFFEALERDDGSRGSGTASPG